MVRAKNEEQVEGLFLFFPTHSSSVKQSNFFFLINLNSFVFEDVWVINMKGNKSERTIVGVNVESPAHLLGRTAVTEYLRQKLE